jgi:peptidyl-Lys metalloendopeptidase
MRRGTIGILGSLAAVAALAAPGGARAQTITFTGCSDDQKQKVNTAATDAVSISNNAHNWLHNPPDNHDRYVTWFGDYSLTTNRQTAKSDFDNIADALTKAYGADCSGTDCKSTWYAFVHPGDTTRVIHLCPQFWKAGETGADSKPGVLVHEMSHFTAVAGTSDYEYGQSDCKALAKSDPTKAVKNADNNEYFAENPGGGGGCGCRAAGAPGTTWGAIGLALALGWLTMRRRKGARR